ncbi:hypothetical protein M409DRAFT_27705 [Zasmidium cellare ATCC 36951]|uniref:Uncharacterized protein n=1 Tax=Zasmidium cellare ATCC 36951 TaxID=1080233 RepID=A0A6A6C8J2_ZASCE|nr:uncharacterized protein M409DRAFT_27705 [Zasmidium cellare ATCC 36951]KAF2161979.1 hypothetical protein M409DRAFT_27705 [Zasmidium cellare ATCC 36951]
MACPCDDCTTLQKARNYVDRIDLLKLCQTEEKENFEVALALSSADDQLTKAQTILTKQHLRAAKRAVATRKSINVSPSKSSEKEGSRDGATVAHSKNSSNGSNGGAAVGEGAVTAKHGEAGMLSSGHHGALVLRENENMREKTNSPAANSRGGTPAPAVAVGADCRKTSTSFTAQDSLLALRLKDTPFGKTISPPVETNSGKNTPSPPKRENNTTPQHIRQVSTTSHATNPWAELFSPVEVSEPFEEHVRSIAKDLGILRGVNVADAGAGVDDSQYATDHYNYNYDHEVQDPELKSRFVVCDHCRAHGLRCNEASVCKECIIRLVPCTHRKCDLSPFSKDTCPRKVCFYVHADHMPDIHGEQNPNDPNWIVLPGKLRDHLSAGAISKMMPLSQNEIMRCFENYERRQQRGFADMQKIVASGQATWETVMLACQCREIEREQQQQKIAEAETRELEAMARAQGIRF